MLEAILLYKGDVQFAAMLLLTAATFRWGAAPERWCGGAFAFMFLIDIPYHWIFGPGMRLSSIDIGHALMDFVTAVAFVVVALRANRMYPLWLAALQLISLASHFVRAANPAMLPLVYATMSIAPSYLELIVLAGGLVNHVRRVKRYGPYRSWRTSSPRSRESAAAASPKG